MYDNHIKVKRFVIYSKNQFDYLINHVLNKRYIVYNVTGFYNRQQIYINVKSNKKEHEPFIFIFDVSNISKDTYINYLGVIKRLIN